MIDFGKYIGIPFVDHGRTMEGCDCWGLVRLIYSQEFGIELDDLGPLYQSTLDADGMRRLSIVQLPRWEKVEVPQVGDGVLLQVKGVPIHVGVIVSDNQMIHVEHGLDAVVERFDTALWGQRVRGFYRYDANLKS
jgi:cell wall-associated NlpC family hydrolase